MAARSAEILAHPATQPAGAKAPPLRLVVVGHVDHGKSTLIGRLLYDTDSLPDGKYEELKAVSEKRGMPLEWSFALDSFQAERDQAITIDTTQIWFRRPGRDTVIIDAPGHREFLKNMVSGAAQADAAVLVIDAAEGVREQTRRHAYLLHLLGLKQVTVAVNKMDLIGHDAARFAALEDEIRRHLAGIGLTPAAVVPISARNGDMIAKRAETMPWYRGPLLLEMLDGFKTGSDPVAAPLRLPIQDVYKFDERRILVGRIESGRLAVGDKLLFSPANRAARIASIEVWNAPAKTGAEAGESIGITLDEQIFVERGDVASHEDQPPMLSHVFSANLFWLGQKPLKIGDRFTLKLATDEAMVTVDSITRVIDTDSLEGHGATTVERNQVAEVTFRSRELLALDPHDGVSKLGRFVLVDVFDTVGGGIISMDGHPDQRRSLTRKADNLFAVDHLLTASARATRNGHKGAVIWFTGLSGAGKSTLAMQVEKRLFERGMQAFVLDGDNVRRGLCADLGFSTEDRIENIRRVGEVAALFAEAGLIVITAFISPYRADRAQARKAAGDSFAEVWIKADLATCEARDPKGLYKKARAGDIAGFTGVSAPYEEPETAELVIDTSAMEVEAAVEAITAYVLGQTKL